MFNSVKVNDSLNFASVLYFDILELIKKQICNKKHSQFSCKLLNFICHQSKTLNTSHKITSLL